MATSSGLTFLVVLLIMVLGLSLAKWGREQAQAQSPDCSIYANVTTAVFAATLPTECYCAWVGAATQHADVLMFWVDGLRIP